MSGDILRRLAAIGLTVEQAAAVLDIFSEQAEERKTKVRERVQRWRAKQAVTDCNVTGRNVTSRNGSRGGDTRVEDISSNSYTSGQEEKAVAPKARGVSGVAGFRAELSDLDPTRLEALVEHRKAKRAACTAIAAALFRRAAKDAGLTLEQAVDTCISRNWITVKAEWLGPRGGAPPPASPPQKPRNAGELARMQLRERENANDAVEQIRPILQAGDGDRNPSGAGIARRFAISSGH